MSNDNGAPAKKPADELREHHLQQLVSNGLSPRAAQATLEVEQIMSRIRRSMARRELGRMAIADLGLDIDPIDLDILAVVESCGEGGEVTVGTIAERLTVDPSRASRIVADAVAKGIVRRVASQVDARRICLELTETGLRHSLAIRKYKWQRFSEALGHWPEEDLVRFAELFARFSNWVADARAGRTAKSDEG